MTVAAQRQPAGSGRHEIALVRAVDASADKVFQAWLDPGQLSNWWGPRDFTTPHAEVDPRPGGTFRTCIRSTRHGDYWARGIVKEFDAPRRLVFTHAWEDERESEGYERLVTVEFRKTGGKTRVTFRIGGFDSVASRDSEVEGWNECLDRLVRHFAEGRKPSASIPQAARRPSAKTAKRRKEVR